MIVYIIHYFWKNMLEVGNNVYPWRAIGEMGCWDKEVGGRFIYFSL